MSLLQNIAAVAIILLMLFLAFKLLAAPLKGLLKLLLHAALGLVILLLVNLVGGFFDFSVPITWVTVLVSGVGGIPGVVLLVLMYLFVL